MDRISAGIIKQRIFLVSSLLYAFGASLLFPVLRYYVDNPDTISYITIAQKYTEGDFAHAVNGYWSPLICWMLGFLLTFLNDEITTFKFLQLLIGWFALFNFTRLVRSLIRQKALQWIVALASVPFILSYALLNLTPDLLFMTVIIFYLNMVSDKEFYNHRHFGLIAGVLGLMLYFSKAFGFYFFLVHFTLLFLRNYMQTKEYPFKKHLRNNYFQAIICFACISAIWIYLISNKYHHFTLSENASFNLSREVAAAPGEVNKLPVLSGGLYKPVNSSAINAWEDPGLAITRTPLEPFASGEDFNMYRLVVKRNLLAIYYFDFRRQIGFVFALLTLAYFISGRRRKLFSNDLSFSLFCTVLLIYGGYSLILVHTRYLWISTLAMILLIACMLDGWPVKNRVQRMVLTAFFLLVMALAVKRPVKEILFSEDKDVSADAFMKAILHPMETIKATYELDLRLFEVRRELAGQIREGETIVSLKKEGEIRDGYTRASLFALGSNAKYLGQVASSDSAFNDQMKRFRIDYLVSFSGNEREEDLPGWRETYANPGIPVKVYVRED